MENVGWPSGKGWVAQGSEPTNSFVCNKARKKGRHPGARSAPIARNRRHRNVIAVIGTAASRLGRRSKLLGALRLKKPSNHSDRRAFFDQLPSRLYNSIDWLASIFKFDRLDFLKGFRMSGDLVSAVELLSFSRAFKSHG